MYRAYLAANNTKPWQITDRLSEMPDLLYSTEYMHTLFSLIKIHFS